ncbi:DUF4355 domain-containing protein [Nocardia sp. NPDC019255]|uniref:capsid assembly scaffolding protein Gp46 family protein n=1 Tax=Nocardia sp. NPDC019255 TaxID=3154591 RepID=UPI003411358B
MTDTSIETEQQEAAPESEQQTAEKTFTQADVDRILAKRLAQQKREHFADYDDLKSAAAELQKIKDANKSESQKLADQLAGLQQQLAERDAQLSSLALEKLRAEVAADKGVPAGRLRGSTKEELEADADAYLTEIASRETATKRKPPAPTGLKSGASSSGSTAANPQEAAAAALRLLRRGGA